MRLAFLERPRAAWLAIAACAALHLVLLAPYVHRHDHDFDAIHLYYPLVQGLAEHGLRFFLTEASLRAPPFSYVYPALLGLPMESLHVFNAGLSIGTLVCVARAAWLMHSPRAGVAAAIMFAASPELRPFLASTLSEPEYLFLCAAWIWALAEWRRSGRDGYLALGAAAMVLALMTRAPLFYGFVGLVAILAVAAARMRFDRRAPATRALVAYALAALVPLAFIAKNWVVFHFPFFTTGAGNALYLGNNPVNGGYDPNYLGIVFDVGEIARDESQLSLHAERLLGGVARMLVAHATLAELVALHAKKLAAFVFVTNAESGAAMLRAWRIATLVLSAVGFLHVRDRWLRAAAAGIAVYLTLAHIPVLYTHRYSVGSLDLWLTIGSGIGIAAISAWSRRRIAVLAAGTALACGVGIAVALLGARPAPDYLRGARLPEWKGEALHRVLPAGDGTVEMAVPVTVGFYEWQDHVLWISATLTPVAGGARCDEGRASFRGPDATEWKTFGTWRPRADGRPHDEFLRGVPMPHVGTAHLRLSWRCSGRVELDLARAQIFSPVGAVGWREDYLHEKPYFPVPLER